MKTSEAEIQVLKNHLKENPYFPKFNEEQLDSVQFEIQNIRKWAMTHSLVHIMLQLTPYVVLGLMWIFIIFALPKLIDDQLILFLIIGILHGFMGYQFVVYGMHEGAGHGLFRNRSSKFQKILNFLAFHSCRLFMADPEFYNKAHVTHHKYLGTLKDQAQTNYVSTKRVIISLLPGAGILFPNDYRIHIGDELTKSQVLSALVGGIRLTLEIYLLSPYLPWYVSLLALALLGPWVGLALDRVRESIEHHMMPDHKIYGSIELGLSPMALILGGGPWGQPCHFCHHLAQDLNWYQQIMLHFKVKNIMNDEQKEFYHFNETPIFILIIKNIKSRYSILKSANKGISYEKVNC